MYQEMVQKNTFGRIWIVSPIKKLKPISRFLKCSAAIVGITMRTKENENNC